MAGGMTSPDPATVTQDHRKLNALFIAAAFVIAGGIHYQTPMLATIAVEFQASPAAVGWIPTLSFGGMLVGIALFVPLGDRISKRWLIIGKIALLGVAQAVMAGAPSITVLAVASLITGICSSVGLVFISIVVEIAPPNHRGRARSSRVGRPRSPKQLGTRAPTRGPRGPRACLRVRPASAIRPAPLALPENERVP